jgi:hypothetical protein
VVGGTDAPATGAPDHAAVCWSLVGNVTIPKQSAGKMPTWEKESTERLQSATLANMMKIPIILRTKVAITAAYLTI